MNFKLKDCNTIIFLKFFFLLVSHWKLGRRCDEAMRFLIPDGQAACFRGALCGVYEQCGVSLHV